MITVNENEFTFKLKFLNTKSAYIRYAFVIKNCMNVKSFYEIQFSRLLLFFSSSQNNSFKVDSRNMYLLISKLYDYIWKENSSSQSKT